MSTDVAASSRRRQGLLMQTAFKLETVQVSNDAASKAFLSSGAFATKGQSSSHWSERRADMRREIQVTSNTSTVRYFSLFPVFGLLLFFRHISTWLAVRIITPRPSKGYFVLSEGCCALVSAIPASRVSSPSVTIPPHSPEHMPPHPRHCHQRHRHQWHHCHLQLFTYMPTFHSLFSPHPSTPH